MAVALAVARTCWPRPSDGRCRPAAIAAGVRGLTTASSPCEPRGRLPGRRGPGTRRPVPRRALGPHDTEGAAGAAGMILRAALRPVYWAGTVGSAGGCGSGRRVLAGGRLGSRRWLPSPGLLAQVAVLSYEDRLRPGRTGGPAVMTTSCPASAPTRDCATSRRPRSGTPSWRTTRKAHPRKVAREFMLIPTTCFNCESACGLLAHVAKDDLTITKLEGNPAHPGSRGRNCAKGPATINQIDDPERILYPLRQAGARGAGQWERVSWDEALDDIAGRIRAAIVEDRRERGDVPRRPAGRGRLRRALPARLGRRRAQLAHQHLLVRRTPRLLPVGRLRPAVARPRERARRSCCCPRTSRPGTTSTRTRSGSWRRKASGTKLVVIDPRMSNTASHADLLDRPLAGQRGRDPAGRRVASPAHDGRSTPTFIRRWVNWETTSTSCTPRSSRRSRRSSTR